MSLLGKYGPSLFILRGRLCPEVGRTYIGWVVDDDDEFNFAKPFNKTSNYLIHVVATDFSKNKVCMINILNRYPIRNALHSQHGRKYSIQHQ